MLLYRILIDQFNKQRNRSFKRSGPDIAVSPYQFTDRGGISAMRSFFIKL